MVLKNQESSITPIIELPAKSTVVANATSPQEERQNTELPKFYHQEFNRKTGKHEIKIDVYRLMQLLFSFGFRRFDLENSEDFIFVHIRQNVVKEVSRHHIIDYFFNWLDKNYQDEKVKLDNLKEQLMKGLATYFSKDILARLVISEPLNFLNDTPKEGFFYFKNVVAVVNAENIDFQEYSKLKGYIWERQIIPRDFQFEENYSEGVFSQFTYLIANKNLEKWISLSTLIGYLLHDYKGGKRKAINFTDGSLDVKNNGRSGKTLLCKAIGKLRVYSEINGKDFKAEDKHKYQDCNLDTQFINLNDVKKSFTLESVYNDITEAVKVEGKNKKPFYIISKFAICSNRPLKTEGGSDKDRVIEFEFSSFFSEKYQPKDHFKHWFFADWNSQEWNKFDSYMLACVQAYLKNGTIEPVNENLNRRKLLEHTDEDFIAFIEGIDLQSNYKYDKKRLFEDFKKTFDREEVKQKRFTDWLKTYAELSGHFDRYIEGVERNPYTNFIVFQAKPDLQGVENQ
jgi:hypothetical protein